jgi:hypothetical protein
VIPNRGAYSKRETLCLLIVISGDIVAGTQFEQIPANRKAGNDDLIVVPHDGSR